MSSNQNKLWCIFCRNGLEQWRQRHCHVEGESFQDGHQQTFARKDEPHRWTESGVWHIVEQNAGWDGG